MGQLHSVFAWSRDYSPRKRSHEEIGCSLRESSNSNNKNKKVRRCSHLGIGQETSRQNDTIKEATTVEEDNVKGNHDPETTEGVSDDLGPHKKKIQREIQDFLCPGIEFPPASKKARVSPASSDDGYSFRSNRPIIVTRDWNNKNDDSDNEQFSADNTQGEDAGSPCAILFRRSKKPKRSLRRNLKAFGKTMKKVIRRFEKRGHRNNPLVKVEKISRGYFRGHVNNEYIVDVFADQLPKGYQVKSTASQKGIVFFNKKAGQCVSHYDRDTSFLLVTKGQKEVFVAKPNALVSSRLQKDSNSTIFEGVDPFQSSTTTIENKERSTEGGFVWEKVVLNRFDGLLIPKDWAHCVRSTKGTIAASLQVGRAN